MAHRMLASVTSPRAKHCSRWHVITRAVRVRLWHGFLLAVGLTIAFVEHDIAMAADAHGLAMIPLVPDRLNDEFPAARDLLLAMGHRAPTPLDNGCSVERVAAPACTEGTGLVPSGAERVCRCLLPGGLRSTIHSRLRIQHSHQVSARRCSTCFCCRPPVPLATDAAAFEPHGLGRTSWVLLR